MSVATDSWRLKNSTIDSRAETVVSDLDVVMFVASMLAVDPKETFGKMKAAAEQVNKKPFWDQMLAICIGYGKSQNRELFNLIGKAVYSDQIKKADDNNDADFSAISDGEMARMYFKARPLIENAINIDGASGTGKSDIVLRFIHFMNNQSLEPRTTIVTAKYGKRMSALKNILNANDDQCFIFAKLAEKLLGRTLTSNDFESHAKKDEKDNGHAQTLKQAVIDELSKRENIWGTDQEVDVYIDESGLFSEAELVFLSEASKLGKVNLIFAGDRMQNGALTSDGLSSDISDCVILGTPRLTLSMRVGNNGMITNLNMIEEDLAKVDEIYRNEPWITSDDANKKLGGILQARTFTFAEKEDAIYGFAITKDGKAALDKLISYKKGQDKGPKIAIITDTPEKYSSFASPDIEVISVEEVQGGEYDYVLADISKIDETRPNVYYKKVYTIISRAKTGGYIVNGLGSKFDKAVPDPLAAIIINPTSNVGNDSDVSLDKYSDWWSNKLMSQDVWNGKTPTPTITSEKSDVNPTTPPPVILPPGTNSGNKAVELPPFDIDAWKAEVRANGAKVKVPYTTQRSQQRLKDLDNYKKYHRVDGEDGDAFPDGGEVLAERLDEGAFAYARHTGDADAQRVSGVRQAPLDDFLRHPLVLRVQALRKGDGAAQDNTIPFQDAVEIVVGGELAALAFLQIRVHLRRLFDAFALVKGGFKIFGYHSVEQLTLEATMVWLSTSTTLLFSIAWHWEAETWLPSQSSWATAVPFWS